MLNDEVLGAYIDDELGPDQRGEIERLLEESPGARMRLERMRGGDAALRRAFGDQRPAAGADATAELVRRGWPTRMPRPSRQMVFGGASIAAACLLGVLGGRLTLAPVGPGMHLSPAMTAALDSAPSGASVPVDGGEMEFALSFRSDSGDVCRQYRTTASGQQADAIACRDSGDWRIAVQAAVVESETYRTAAANDPIAAAVARKGGVAVLDAAEERALIASRWQRR